MSTFCLKPQLNMLIHVPGRSLEHCGGYKFLEMIQLSKKLWISDVNPKSSKLFRRHPLSRSLPLQSIPQQKYLKHHPKMVISRAEHAAQNALISCDWFRARHVTLFLLCFGFSFDVLDPDSIPNLSCHLQTKLKKLDIFVRLPHRRGYDYRSPSPLDQLNIPNELWLVPVDTSSRSGLESQSGRMRCQLRMRTDLRWLVLRFDCFSCAEHLRQSGRRAVRNMWDSLQKLKGDTKTMEKDCKPLVQGVNLVLDWPANDEEIESRIPVESTESDSSRTFFLLCFHANALRLAFSLM
uniref:Uncharacterized protein n=1 Tax=Timema bartmani TaxID=61472 RepID=A0A7R9ETY5_9NEOP|nr:unnamed protein product [Timema bartmani]